MKQITVLSGKGGTGKTTIASSFAVLAGSSVIADCDVDAANLHLLLHPEVKTRQEFYTRKAEILDEKCIKCGRCEEECRFGAISDFKVDPILCEGCGVCTLVCPVGAVRLSERVSGYAYISETKFGPMCHARLLPGESNSGKLVALVRENARKVAEARGLDLVIIDGAPGIGCPVIASVTGIDLGVVVTEPTMSGLHDMERALRLLDHFRVPALVCINKYDLNEEKAEEIVEFCESRGIEVMAKIPFNKAVTDAMVKGKTIIEYSGRNPASEEIKKAWKRVLRALNET